MLDRARARLQSNYPAAASALRFVQGEIAPANLTDTFDLVICPLGALSAWINPDQQRDCVRAIRACLVLGGHCAIDVNVPCLGRLIDAMNGAQPFAGERLDRLGPAPGVARFVSEVRTTSYDAASQSETAIRHSEIYFADGRHQSLVRERTWHQYFPNELRHLFFSNGFAPVAEYGTYELAPFSATSPQYLWVMVAA